MTTRSKRSAKSADRQRPLLSDPLGLPGRKMRDILAK